MVRIAVEQASQKRKLWLIKNAWTEEIGKTAVLKPQMHDALNCYQTMEKFHIFWGTFKTLIVRGENSKVVYIKRHLTKKHLTRLTKTENKDMVHHCQRWTKESSILKNCRRAESGVTIIQVYRQCSIYTKLFGMITEHIFFKYGYTRQPICLPSSS